MSSPAESLLRPLRDVGARTGLTDFLQWWKGELAAMVPAGWRERLSHGGTVFVSIEGDEWRAFRPGSGGLVEAGRLAIGSLQGAERRAAFRRLLDGGAGGAPNVWLVLPRTAVLTRSVSLPLAAEEALRDAVGFELDRLTPFTAEQACFDFRVTGRDTAAQVLGLDLAVSARAGVEARLALLRDLGARALGVGVEGDLSVASAPFNLLAPEERERPATSPATVAARAFAALAGILAVALLAFPLWQKREAVIDLQPRLDRAKAGADVADRLAKEIEKLAAEHNFVVTRKQAQHPAVVLLEDLSRLLPDTTWVQQMDIKAGPKIRELQIQGETASSSQLVEILEKSGSLANASFKSPLTKGVTPGTERFLLAAEVKPRTLPEPIPEATLKAPPATRPAPAPASPTPAGAPAIPAVPAAQATVPPVPAAPVAGTPPPPAAAPPVATVTPAPIPVPASIPPAPKPAPMPPKAPASQGAGQAPAPAAPTSPGVSGASAPKPPEPARAPAKG